MDLVRVGVIEHDRPLAFGDVVRPVRGLEQRRLFLRAQVIESVVDDAGHVEVLAAESGSTMFVTGHGRSVPLGTCGPICGWDDCHRAVVVVACSVHDHPCANRSEREGFRPPVGDRRHQSFQRGPRRLQASGQETRLPGPANREGPPPRQEDGEEGFMTVDDFGPMFENVEAEMVRLMIDSEIESLTALAGVLTSLPYQDLDLIKSVRVTRKRLGRFRDLHF